MDKNHLIALFLVLFHLKANGCSGVVTSCVLTLIDSDYYYGFYTVTLSCSSVANEADDHDHDSCYSEYFNQTLNNFANVIDLSTSDCRGEYLDENFAKKFENLRKYDVSFYGLKNLSNSDLKFRNLKDFNASHNQITNLSSPIFLSSSIISLDFSFNQIVELAPEVFSSLVDLRFLDLSSNFIKSIDKHLFDKNVKLNFLNLEKNPIKHFNENITFLLLNIRSLQVSVYCENFEPFYGMKMDIQLNYNKLCIYLYRRDSFEGSVGAIKCSKESLDHLTYVNISGNQNDRIDKIVDLLGPSIEVLDVSSNRIPTLNAHIFERFRNLTYLDLRNTGLSTIQFESLHHLSFPEYNEKLTVLQLENNPIEIIDCSLFSLLIRMPIVKISLENVMTLDTSCFGKSLSVKRNDRDEIVFRLTPNNSEFRYAVNEFQKLTFLNLSSNQVDDAQLLIGILNPSIEVLDLSETFVGQLNSHAFNRFNRLQILGLSNCNLTNFGFATFYHQKKLIVLDISGNHLKKINFTLFLRNFRELTALNLEGNDLVEIDTVTHSIFPKLNLLGISKNHFSCDYLVTYLRDWEDLRLMANPTDSNQTNIDGVDCHDFKVNNEASKTQLHRTQNEFHGPTQTSPNSMLELRVLMYLTLTIICGYFVMKSNLIRRFRNKLPLVTMDDQVLYRQHNQESCHCSQLVHTENVNE